MVETKGMRGRGTTVKGITFVRKGKLEKKGRKDFEARGGGREAEAVLRLREGELWFR